VAQDLDSLNPHSGLPTFPLDSVEFLGVFQPMRTAQGKAAQAALIKNRIVFLL
jgi:hypothetical protein